MRSPGILIAILLALSLAGCGEDRAAAPASATPEPPTVAAPGVQAPPTWTAGPERALATPAPGVSAPAGRGGTLPATWTPLPQAMPMATARPSQTPLPERPTRTPLPEWCSALRQIAAPDLSYTGLPISILWAPVPDVPAYHVELRNPNGTILVSETVSVTEYTFPAELFQEPNVYGWAVTALDESGAPVCYSITNEIVVRAAPS